MTHSPSLTGCWNSPRHGTSYWIALWRAWLALTLLVSASTTGSAQVAGAIAVYPEKSSLEYTSTQQFTAYVPISPNTITWSVNDVIGGNASLGTISPTGLYTPPAVIPVANVLTIKARSTAYPSSVGSATLTVTKKYPWLWSASPASLKTGNYSVSFNGSNFAPDSVGTANGVDLATTYYSPTKLVVTGAAAAAGNIVFAVRQPGPGAVTGNTVTVPVTAVAVAVAVAPTTSNVILGNGQTFTATVTGTANAAVTWSVNGVNGGSSTTGTVSPAGIYTAPAVMPASSTVTVRATSVASPATYAQATVTLITPPPPVTVAIAPPAVTLQLGITQSFVATVTGSANTAVTWTVNGVAGGSSALGTITSAGLYKAPTVMPASATLTLRATSVVNPSSYAQATVTLIPPVTVAVNPTTASIALGTAKAFVATVGNSANTSVTWSVNGVNGGSVALGLINATGVYVAPTAMPASSTVTVRATSVANPAVFANAMVTLTPPPPPTVSLSNARFLEQSSFGPTDASLAEVQQLGFTGYLQKQFSLPASVIPVPADNWVGALQQWQLYNFTVAPDQLRQRVVFALSQILVISANKQIYADAMLPWMRALSQNAFGTYKDLLREVSKSPSMGKYLDLANSMKPGLGGGANENFARELMQLFTIGLWELNQDGTLKFDGNGEAIPTYNQATVAQVALALTGWTYATAPGATPQAANYDYFGAPMETRPQNHATSSKTFLGATIPANQSVDQDMESVLTILMNHPNTAPFICTRLIRSLVVSNPTPGYVQRVANVFTATGGNLQAVVTAILMDAEARNDTPTVNGGRLKDPIVHVSSFMRALGGHYNPGEQLTYLYGYMAQYPLNPNSVFSWFSPMYRVPKSPLFGPEFQIYSPTEATLRGNFFQYLLSSPGGDFVLDLTPFQAYGNDMPGLVEAVNQRLLYGRMPAGMKQALITAATPGYDAKTRIETVIYLTALSGQYAIQY